MMITWSERIRDLRTTGLTLAEIGERTGLAPSTVSDLEQERSKSPRGEAAIRLHHLHEELCGGAKHAPPRFPTRSTAES